VDVHGRVECCGTCVGEDDIDGSRGEAVEYHDRVSCCGAPVCHLEEHDGVGGDLAVRQREGCACVSGKGRRDGGDDTGGSVRGHAGGDARGLGNVRFLNDDTGGDGVGSVYGVVAEFGSGRHGEELCLCATTTYRKKFQNGGFVSFFEKVVSTHVFFY
jgi:hypothetical protein